MILKIQIYSIVYSFIFGIIFYFILELNNKFIYNANLLLKLISSFLVSIFCAILYFILLLKINNGILHLYFFFSLIMGYIITRFTYLYIKKYFLLKFAKKKH